MSPGHTTLSKPNVLGFQSRRWSRWIGTLWNNPQLSGPSFAISSVDYHETIRVKEPSVDEVRFQSGGAGCRLAAVCERFPSTRTPLSVVAPATVENYVTDRTRPMVERHGKVVQPRLFVVAT